MKAWMKKFGATKGDIKEAMKIARELPSYHKLLTVTRENTTPHQEENGTISFVSASKILAPNGLKWDRTYVHFYGQVRTGVDGGSYNSPVKMDGDPEIIENNPVQTIVNAYDKGFKKIFEVFKKMKTRIAPEVVMNSISSMLGKRFDYARFRGSKTDREYTGYEVTSYTTKNFPDGLPHLIVLPPHTYDTYKTLFKGGQSPESFFSALTDDDDFTDNLKQHEKERVEKLLKSVGSHNTSIDRAEKDLKNYYKKFDIHVKVCSLEDVRERLRKNASHVITGFNMDFCRKIKVLDITISKNAIEKAKQ
jgi:hypothetical protein